MSDAVSGTPVMPVWDPQQYLRHADHRARPVHDLLARIRELPNTPPRIADVGCGPGNVTSLLFARWPDADITGFDSSIEMLDAAQRYAGVNDHGGRLEFRLGDAAQWTPEQTYDLIVSSAALQWVEGHADRFPDWFQHLAPGGVLAFQVPANFTSPSHALVGQLCESPRWRMRLGDGLGRRFVHILDGAEYLDRLTTIADEVDVWDTTYVRVLPGEDPVFEWTKGTALRPILTALADDPRAEREFLAEYRALLRSAYPKGRHGTVFPFRRVFAVARKAVR